MRPLHALVMASAAVLGLAPETAWADEKQAPKAAPAQAPMGTKTLDRVGRVALEITTGFFTTSPSPSSYGASNEAAAMVRETREIDLPTGTTELGWGDLPDTLRSETTDVRVPAGVTLVAQRFEETMPGPSGIAGLLRGQQVIAHPRYEYFTPYMRERGAPQAWKGTIVSLDGGVVLQVGRTLTVLPPSEVTLVEPSKGAPKRRLVLVLSAPSPTRARVAVTGVVERIVPHGPRYSVTLDPIAHEARLRGTVVVSNGTSMDLSGAKLFWGETLFEAFRERSSGSALDLARTWLARDSRARAPFEVGEALRFSALGVAEPVLVDASRVPYVEKNVAAFSSLDTVRDKPESPLRLPVSIAWTLDKSAFGASTKFPSGDAWMSDGTAGAPPGVVGQGVVHHRAPGMDVEVLARATTLVVESKFLGGPASNDCAATTKWEHAIPASALARGPFILELPFEKKRLEARIGKIEGVVVETTADGTSRIVVAELAPDQARKLGMAEGAPRKIVVTYKTNRCK